MHEIQQATLYFFGPVTIAYFVAGLLLWLQYRQFPSLRGTASLPSDRPGFDFFLGLSAAISILLIGNFLRIDKVWKPDSQPWSGLWWMITNLEIYSPIIIVLYIRRQSFHTLFLTPEKWMLKVVLGLIAGYVCAFLFVILRGEAQHAGEVLSATAQWRSLQNFPAVFLEGVAVAFLFVRLQWWIGIRWAILVPAAMFAFSHVPGAVDHGDSIFTIACFFILNTIICGFLLYVCQKARDVIFLGMVHYVMDVAIRAFE